MAACDPGDPVEVERVVTETARVQMTDYLVNRYFRLDTSQLGPIFFPAEPGGRPAMQEMPGYDPAQLSIDPNSIELFATPAVGTGADILDRFEGWALIDTTGLGWEQEGVPFDPSVLPLYRSENADRWRKLGSQEWELLRDSSNRMIGVVLDRSLRDAEALGAVYTLVDNSTQAVVRRVGRSPSSTPGTVTVTFPGATTPEEIYLFKLIKARDANSPRYEGGAWGPRDLTWEYMFRHWYALGIQDLEPRGLQVEIHRRGVVTSPAVDSRYDVPWLRVFGLDRFNEAGGDPNLPDGRIDTQTGLIDYARGTMQFPCFTPFDQPDNSLAEYARIPGYTLPPELRPDRLYTGVYTAETPGSTDQLFEIVVRKSRR